MKFAMLRNFSGFKTEFVVSSFSLTIFLHAVSKQMNKSFHAMANGEVVLLERYK